MEFTLIKSRAMTLSRSPQYRAFSRAVMDEKSSSPLFPVGGAVVTNDWCTFVTSYFIQDYLEPGIFVLKADVIPMSIFFIPIKRNRML